MAMNSFSLLILMDLCGHLANAVTDMKRSGMEVRLVVSDVFLGSLFVFNRVEIHLLKIPSGTILVLFESILVPEIYKNPSKTYCFRGIQLNINKKRNDPTFTVHPAFKAPGGHFLFILYTIVRKICQTSLILS